MSFLDIRNRLIEIGDNDIAQRLQGFFKTEKGQYGEGDIFLGVKVPVIRKEVKKFKDEDINGIEENLKSKYHEERLFALIWLVSKYQKGDNSIKNDIYAIYLRNVKYVNNWDLVDSSAHLIVGPHIQDSDKSILYKFSKSNSLWERRISIMSTFHYIKKGDFKEALAISEVLVNDKEDLIQKAVGWMLREVGNRDKDQEVQFLRMHYKSMPRTMLRYAIEKFSKEERVNYLKGSV